MYVLKRHKIKLLKVTWLGAAWYSNVNNPVKYITDPI